MKYFVFFIASLLTVLATAQDKSDPVLLTIDEKPVTKSEFTAIFKKNNRDSAITKEDLDEYVQLFINFKLKVAEAEALGMDTAKTFTRELNGYREQLARPYLADKLMTDSLVREAYDRMKYEVRAAHILLKLPPDPTPEDTLASFQEAVKLKEKLLSNPDEFEATAKKISADPSARQNGGDLGYFTAMQMVYPFENAVFNTAVGQIGGPVRTQYGYHLIKVEDRRAARGQVRVAHIMIRSEEKDPEDVQANLQTRALDVYNRLQKGESFAELAKKFSDDRSSAEQGGELPPFGSGKMVLEFENAAFSLNSVGQISEPIKSPYGWHILKLLERIPLAPYTDMEKDLRNKVSKDSRSSVSQNSFIAKRKTEYNFSEDRNQLKPYYTSLDTSYFTGRWKPSKKLLESKKVLFSMSGTDYTQSDFTNYLLKRMRPSRKPMPIRATVNDSYKTFVDNIVMEYEDGQLEQKYPDFKALINEYRDGILLFDLTDQKVWSKAVKDSIGLAQFYAAHQSDFMWKERAAYDIYTVEDRKAAKMVKKMLKKGKNQDDIRSALNSDSALGVKIESGVKEQEDVPVLSKIDWEAGISDVVDDGGQMKVVNIKKIIAAEPKDFDEARGLITAAYQNQLEKEWIASLRAEHEVEVNEDILYSIQ